MNLNKDQLRDNIHSIQNAIAQMATKHHRQSDQICLLAVSKKKPAEQIRIAFDLGQKAFGENYLQEALDKQQQLLDLDIDWHFIGPIQSNKTRDISANFSWVHSVDRVKIAKRLNDQRPAHLPPLNICLQVNIDNEPSKSGIAPEKIMELTESIMALPRLKLRGLMAIPAPKESFEEQFKTFKRVHDIMKKTPEMDTLSMGMSGDMDAAIAAGSTMVRVGTAIFGSRKSSSKV